MSAAKAELVGRQGEAKNRKPRKPRATKPKVVSIDSTALRPTAIPKGFTMVIDTREQQPLFADREDIPIMRVALHDGDYSVLGFEADIIIERKKLSDFLSYIGKERTTKTIPKLTRLAKARFAALIIEESEKVLAGPFKHSTMTGEHVRAFLISCRVRYGVHVYINKDRAALERFVLDHLVKAWAILKQEHAMEAGNGNGNTEGERS